MLLRKRILLTSLIWVLLAPALTFGDDWQSWYSFGASYKLESGNTVSALGEMYFRDDMSDDYVRLLYASYLHAVGSGISLLGQGYIESVQDVKGDWDTLESVVVGPVYRLPLGFDDWSVAAQIRFFYQISPTAQWDYYRPRIAAIRRLSDRWSLNLENELRIDLTGERETSFYRNRVFLTLTAKLSDCLLAGIGYVRQSDKIDGGWQGFNVLHAGLSWNF